MAKGLPWAGSYGKKPSARDQYAPALGSYAAPQASVPAPSTNSDDTHKSLAKEFGPKEVREKGRT